MNSEERMQRIKELNEDTVRLNKEIEEINKRTNRDLFVTKIFIVITMIAITAIIVIELYY